MAKYRKKPVVIEAIQWTGENNKDIYDFAGDKVVVGSNSYEGVPPTMFISTLEGNMTASMGDYIIKGVKSEFYACKPDVFEQTYESVEE